MIVDVYDLTATLCCSRYEVDEKQCSIKLIERKPFSDVLIEPNASKSRNQPPYLQEWDCPILRDLVDEKGEFRYDNCSFLPDFFQQENQDVRKMADFFRALRNSSYIRFEQPANENVILIPDNFDATLQENILRSCALPRDKTSLLWRSVAICLGNAEKIPNGYTEMTITDYQRRYQDEAKLTLCHEEGLLVPQRKAYISKDAGYKHDLYQTVDPYADATEFYRHTYCGSSAKDEVIWNAEKKQFEKAQCTQKEERRGSILILDGGELGALFSSIKKADAFSASDGAALYMARRKGGRPTYYDECTGLYIVVQDSVTETIYAKELIAPNTRCKGGEEIKGDVYTDCFIEKGSNLVGFRLSDDSGDDVQLKKLDYAFGIRATKEREPLTLHPSMTPGQGMARVLATGEKQLTETVELDLLKMEESKETIKSLRENMDRSFPIDIPAIKANTNLWQKKVRGEVERYLRKKSNRNKKMFSRCRSENCESKDVMEKLQRINVFGYAKGEELPQDSSGFDFDHLFKELADDYKVCRNTAEEKDVLAMISRTYQGNNEHFRPIKEEILKEVQKSVAGGESINPHKMTACAYLLRDQKELSVFFRCYLSKLRKAESPKGLSNWHRAVADLLMQNGDMLKGISTEECEQCMIILLKFLKIEDLSPTITCLILKVCLLLLIKRKYDKSFLREERLYQSQVEILEKVKKRDIDDDKVKGWCETVLKFVKGKGRLSDLVIVVEEDDDGQE